MPSDIKIEAEYLKLNAKNEWSVLFQKIRTECSASDFGISNQCTEALKPQNKTLNRYRDVSPFDHSRIVLKRGATDYINANLIKVEKANRQYILTQGPLVNTVNHFWLMVWEQETKAVLMLNKLYEKRQEKCFQYWPAKIGPDHKINMEDVGLELEYIEQQDHSYYLTRTLRLTDTENKKSRDILQFHYTTWPDFGVPTSPTAFLEFLKKVRAAGVLESSVGPAVVHCSAGIGRSGTFCLVDSCLILIEKSGPNSVDVKEILYEMRKYRMGLIQTPEQLRFSYEAIIEGTKQLINPNANIGENNIHISNHASEDGVEEGSSSDDGSEDDGPPPVPPPRLDSLKKQNGSPMDRPLPMIPTSESLNDFNYTDDKIDESVESDPISESSEDELEEDDELRPNSSSPTEDTHADDRIPASELRHRKRLEHKEKLEAKVKDMKRRQQINEQWTQLKRSLYKPLLVAGTFVIGGGLIAYFYFKD